MNHYDLIVIGSGPAGEKGVVHAAYFGKHVALVYRAARPGGAPVNNGGLPTKTLRETALYLAGYRRRELYGVGLELGPELMLDRLRTEPRPAERTSVRLDLRVTAGNRINGGEPGGCRRWVAPAMDRCSRGRGCGRRRGCSHTASPRRAA